MANNNKKKFCAQISFGVFLGFSALLVILIAARNREMACVFCEIVSKKTNTEILFEVRKTLIEF